MSASHPRILLEPAILAGKPVVRGTCLVVDHLIRLLTERWSEAEILAAYKGGHTGLAACLVNVAEGAKHYWPCTKYQR